MSAVPGLLRHRQVTPASEIAALLVAKLLTQGDYYQGAAMKGAEKLRGADTDVLEACAAIADLENRQAAASAAKGRRVGRGRSEAFAREVSRDDEDASDAGNADFAGSAGSAEGTQDHATTDHGAACGRRGAKAAVVRGELLANVGGSLLRQRLLLGRHCPWCIRGAESSRAQRQCSRC